MTNCPLWIWQGGAGFREATHEEAVEFYATLNDDLEYATVYAPDRLKEIDNHHAVVEKYVIFVNKKNGKLWFYLRQS